MIRAITFDFWDTLAVDDSDEPKRAALGLPSKSTARKELFAQRIGALYPEIAPAQAMAAYDVANQRFRDEWHTNHQTPGVTTRIYYAYEHLGLAPEPGHYARLVREIDELVREIETMEVRIPPDFVPDLHYTLELLAREYKLGIISDTIHTHGRGLRHLLDRQGILPYFSYLIFSDEIRSSKPATAVFRQAAIGLDVVPTEIVHVGDRETNDIQGPLQIGMKAILFTGIVDRGSKQTHAHAVCHKFTDLPRLVSRLD